ncbi:hypothetical protein DFP93_108105 [Aneurinibacillus soli]|uniref:Uncharacterized protein n=1 Tax=Aneurinibacillus soli TaxID=1500254 RepID=A0A0U5AWB9_9BACL|nr:hypothetical protein DFP93_108105 [Aneurinibacillus soli]BAU26514.1 hypothetical protein CB4_00641 [Aneurinibacillus soli]
MIICPKTKHELTRQGDYLYCAESGYKGLIRLHIGGSIILVGRKSF